MERFCQLLWRSRPPSLLTEEHLKVAISDDDVGVCFILSSPPVQSIKADFKKYQYKYEQKDRTLKTKASKVKKKKHSDQFVALSC